MSRPLIQVKWVDAGREPKMAPNPKFPKGIDLDLTHGRPRFCKTELPYPAKRCGYYKVECLRCHYSAIITTAGRPDDPRSVKLPCKRVPS